MLAPFVMCNSQLPGGSTVGVEGGLQSSAEASVKATQGRVPRVSGSLSRIRAVSHAIDGHVAPVLCVRRKKIYQS